MLGRVIIVPSLLAWLPRLILRRVTGYRDVAMTLGPVTLSFSGKLDIVALTHEAKHREQYYFSKPLVGPGFYRTTIGLWRYFSGILSQYWRYGYRNAPWERDARRAAGQE